MKSKYPKKLFPISVEPDLIDIARAQSKKRGSKRPSAGSVSEVIRIAFKKFLLTVEPNLKNKNTIDWSEVDLYTSYKK